MACRVLDGPVGTELTRRGIDLPPPAWSALALDACPELVATIHRDYVAAGAEVHTANTFRTKRRCVGARWEELARRAVALLRDAAPGLRIAGSIAPLEDCYRPDLSPGARSAAEHRELAQLLAAEGVDVLLCETFAHPLEAAIAVEEAARTGVETWVALTAGPGGDLLTPARMREAALACVRAGARGVLVNCTPASRTLPFVRAIADLGVPFGAYANAGDASEGLGWSSDPLASAEAYAAHASQWVEAGATLVGGCCGTGPEHIRALASRSQRTARVSTRP
jgi:S-methylmethionine-dependent homocysteine/selenocysteine methylase